MLKKFYTIIKKYFPKRKQFLKTENHCRAVLNEINPALSAFRKMINDSKQLKLSINKIIKE